MAGDVIGRESELAILHRFLDSIPTGPSALLLSGDPGIGKTTVWKEGLAGAQLRRYRTLSCGPVEAETRLSYAALGDLLEPILEEALPTLPEPQRQALEVALLRSPSSGARADQRAVSLAVLGCLRSVASTSPVVVAVDDIQWMDLPSVRVLQFVVRRLKDEQVGLMTAARGARADDDPLGVVVGLRRGSRASPSTSGRCRRTPSNGCSGTRWGRGSPNHAPQSPRDVGRQSLLRPGDRTGAPSPWR